MGAPRDVIAFNWEVGSWNLGSSQQLMAGGGAQLTVKRSVICFDRKQPRDCRGGRSTIKFDLGLDLSTANVSLCMSAGSLCFLPRLSFFLSVFLFPYVRATRATM